MTARIAVAAAAFALAVSIPSTAHSATPHGIAAVSNALLDDVVVTPDGTGGILIGWAKQGVTDKDVFAIRYTGTGALATGWSASGTLVCDATDDQSIASVTRDGAGGAILAW